ncbi:MAG: IPT/TIG domain-containing protein, partial [Cytophagales bacterium]
MKTKLLLLSLCWLLGGHALRAQTTITSFAPASGTVGTSVTITGTNFSTTPANNVVKFNGVTATVTASTATSITATVPTGATSGTISVTVAGTATSATSFTVVVPPTIASFAPASGTVGTSVTITGTNFSTTPANNIVFFGATRATVTG